MADRVGSSGPEVALLRGAAGTVFDRLRFLEARYPGFERWFAGKVVPGLADGSRAILTRGPQNDPDGVAIVKNDGIERKLCTLWVSEERRGSGTGADLLAEAIDVLGTKRPLVTCGADEMFRFESLFSAFEVTNVVRSAYRPGFSELVFNGDCR